MCIRYLGFLLLICLPGILHGQSAPQSCTAPNLDGGFFAPKLETYPHRAQLTYTCNSGRVPVVRGWWVTSSCQNGKWSHEPQCIESLHACSVPPKIPHAIIINQEYQDLFAADSVLQYECEEGFTVEGVDTKKTIICISGNWTTASPCRSSSSSGGNDREGGLQITTNEKACFPPDIPHAEHHQDQDHWYKEGYVFRVSCQKGYEHKDRNATTTCSNGAWTLQLVCERSSSACGEPPEIPHAVIINQEYQDVFAADSVLHYECEEGFTVEGVDTKKIIICISGNWSTASPCRRTGSGSTVGVTNGGHTTSTQPTGRGSSSSSGGNDREGGLQITTITNCGRYPRVSNGDVVETGPMFLKYQCSSFYKRVGPQKVVCYSDGTWSPLPTCKAAFCEVDTAHYDQLENVGVKFIGDGQKVELKCDQAKWYWVNDHYSEVQCTDGRIRFGRCCSWLEALQDRGC